MTKSLWYVVRGIIADVIIVAVIGILVLVDIASSYRGRCGVFWFFGGAGHPCSRLEYVKEEAGFFFIALVGLPESWLVILPALCIMPVLSYLFGRWKAKSMTG
jgi:hypothetical protein